MEKLEQITTLLLTLQRQIGTLSDTLRISPNQVNLTTLSDLSNQLGLVQAGELRSGNGKNPGDGFTGMRVAYPPMMYSGDLWHLAGVENDEIQAGISASGGKFMAAGGKLIIDKNAIQITGLLYPITQTMTNAGNTRKVWLGSWLPAGSSIPAWGIIYSSANSASNLISEGTFELGNLTGWTQSGSSFSVLELARGDGIYGLYCDDITAGTNTLTSSRHSCSGNIPYVISLNTKDNFGTVLSTSVINATSFGRIADGFPTTALNSAGNALGKLGSSFSEGTTRQIYEFDLSSFSNVTAADLRVSIGDWITTQGNVNISVHQLLKNSIGNQMTWNSYSTGNAWTTAGGGNVTDSEGSSMGSNFLAPGIDPQSSTMIIPIDKTKLSQMLSGGTFSNNGFIIKSNKEGLTGTTTTTWTTTEEYISGYIRDYTWHPPIYDVTTSPKILLQAGYWTYVIVPVWSSRTIYHTSTAVIGTDAFVTLSGTPTLNVSYLTTTQPDYIISMRWYDALSGGTLLRTDQICENDGVSTYHKRARLSNSPTAALSFDIIITATVGSNFYVDDINVSLESTSQSLWFTDAAINTDNRINVGTTTGDAIVDKNFVSIPWVTTTERNALSVAVGTIVWNTTTTQLEVYKAAGWAAV